MKDRKDANGGSATVESFRGAIRAVLVGAWLAVLWLFGWYGPALLLVDRHYRSIQGSAAVLLLVLLVAFVGLGDLSARFHYEGRRTPAFSELFVVLHGGVVSAGFIVWHGVDAYENPLLPSEPIPVAYWFALASVSVLWMWLGAENEIPKG